MIAPALCCFLLVGAASCTRSAPFPPGEEAAAAPQPPPSRLATRQVDPPRALPQERDIPAAPVGSDEVPAFLAPTRTPDQNDASDDSLEAWMAQVQVGGDGGAGSFASIQVEPPAAPEPPPEAPASDLWPDSTLEEAIEWEAAQEAPRDLPLDVGVDGTDDPCAHLERLLQKRQAYLARVASERDTFGWVDDPADAEALRLLQGLRRCQEFPDDEDCKAPPIERDLRDLEPPPHQFERWPTELVVEEGAEDRVVHDPQSLDLLHRIRSCRRAATPQPLLR